MLAVSASAAMTLHHDDMRFARHRLQRILLMLGLAVSLAATIGSVAAARSLSDGSLLDRLTEIEDEFVPGSNDASDRPALRLMMEEIVRALPRYDSSLRGAGTVLALNHLVFDDLGIRVSQDLRDPENLLPSRVFERKQGYCVGIAALYLLLAEQLDLPIYAVATPSHVFLRYDDGSTRINIETLQRGANVPDDQYIREQKIPEESIRRGVFMRNLTTGEFLGQVHNNLGVIYSERKDFDAAAREYESALDLDPRLPVALYNWGNDLLRQGLYRRAVRLFSRSLRLYPTDVWALNNQGLAYKKLGKPQKARRDFEAAMRIEPGFDQAARNLRDLNERPADSSSSQPRP
jgi:regulator of sirC expression with transglutaminase-like and TPR domain